MTGDKNVTISENAYRTAALDMLWLTGCVLNGEAPSPERVGAMDIPLLYTVASDHTMAAITARALRAAGVTDPAFTQDLGKALQKNALMDTELRRLSDFMDSRGIWYMPLKGAVLKELYPSAEMRQMSDIDVLFDEEHREEIRDFMTDNGFTVKHYGSRVDVYQKPPSVHFEMHTALYGAVGGMKALDYYSDVKDRLIPDSRNGCGYHFSPEDFFIYMLSHEYKHYAASGTGLRSLPDLYLYLRRFGGSMDMNYICGELEKLSIRRFGETSRSLAVKVFESGELSEEESAMLDYMIFSGTYGRVANRVNNGVRELGGGTSGRVRYFWRRVFLPMDIIKEAHPFYYRHKALLPLLMVKRAVTAATVRRAAVKSELYRIIRGGKKRR